jgi:hypothetical protein
LASLNESVMHWYPRKLDIKEIVISCGEFPNVPLIGSKACINYNAILTLRQLGHPIWEKPEEKSLECLVLHDMGANDPVVLQKIIRTWENLTREVIGNARLDPAKRLNDNGLKKESNK